MFRRKYNFYRIGCANMVLCKLWYLAFIFTCSSACLAFGASNTAPQRKNQNEISWFHEKLHHQGLGLSDHELSDIALLSNEHHFNQTLMPLLIPRVPDTPNHAAVRKFLVDQMKSVDWTVEEHQFKDRTPMGSKTFTNIIATLNPSATRRLIIACHYDSKLTPTGFIGATDSAVPCAMMINLAYVLNASLATLKDERPDLTLQFLFFDGEEAFRSWTSTDSLYGSRKLASKLHGTAFPLGNREGTSELHRIDLFVLLDLIGTEDCQFYSYYRNTNEWYMRLASFEKRLDNLNLINKRSTLFSEKSYYGAGIADDHIPFLKRNVPILHVISGPFPSVWHEMSDNLDALHPPSIQNMNTLLRAFVVDYLHLSL